ncbi:MAG: acyltransferase [Micromonosporaceae bacterium]|nr:acyltransferase [Micromonosporaceae bacterium]
MRPLRQLDQIARQTRPTRNRYVDLLRALALLMVVLGHWLVSSVSYDGHRLPVGHSALESLHWAYPITWVVQVMPVFFIVGGYANAAALASHRRKGGTVGGWLSQRAARLLRSTTVLLLVLAAGSLLARLLHAEPTEVRYAVWVASIPLWFLSAYLVVIVLTAPMYALHQRFGLAVPAALGLLVALGDVARFAGHGKLAAGNLVFGWLVMHQIGFFWRDGRLRFTPRVAWCLLLGGVVALVLLTVVGPYPVSMIDVSGERIKNASPPTLALLATATAQLGLIVLLERPAQRWLSRRRPWLAVIAASRVVLTIFLWHMSAVALLAGGLAWAGLLPTPRVGTASWWLWRIPWLLMLAAVLAVLVAIFAPVEVHRIRHRSGIPGWLPARAGRALTRPAPYLATVVAALLAVAVALWVNNIAPQRGHEPFGLPTAALVLYLAGALVLRLVRAVPEPRVDTR